MELDFPQYLQHTRSAEYSFGILMLVLQPCAEKHAEVTIPFGMTPKPPAYRYPYPSFLHLVYAAHGVAHHPEARKADDYVQGSSLKHLTEVPSLTLPSGQLHFLAAAQATLRAQARP
jgi:hypothetical protein